MREMLSGSLGLVAGSCSIGEVRGEPGRGPRAYGRSGATPVSAALHRSPPSLLRNALFSAE
eukprot:188544-Alexandrium_andersonii.AAC.1